MKLLAEIAQAKKLVAYYTSSLHSDADVRSAIAYLARLEAEYALYKYAYSDCGPAHEFVVIID